MSSTVYSSARIEPARTQRVTLVDLIKCFVDLTEEVGELADSFAIDEVGAGHRYLRVWEDSHAAGACERIQRVEATPGFAGALVKPQEIEHVLGARHR